MSSEPPHGAAKGPGPEGSPGLDPRRTITPESFAVAPELLGLPLAGPWRRAVAMLVDLVLVAMLTNAGGVILAFGAAFFLWRATRREAAAAPDPFYRRWTRGAARALAILIVFVATLAAVFSWGDDDAPAPPDAPAGVAALQDLGVLGALGKLGELNQLRRAETLEEARPLARDFVAMMHAGGATRRDLLEMAEGLPPASDTLSGFAFTEAARAALLEAVDAVAPAAAAPAGTADPDSLAVLWATALEQGDSAAIDTARRQLLAATAADTLAALDDAIRSLRQRNEAVLEQMRELEAEEEGFVAALLSWADELGVGVGWFGLYFTAFLALWSGRTPGKRLLGLRVVRLDGKPIGWWAAFERFGGYAAGFVTGLLGFLQVLWDDNRQGIHDQIARTVVVRD